jgi:hypothetical protein
MITAETIRYAEHINRKYPQVPVDNILSIWYELEKTPLDTSDIATDSPRNECIYTE